MSGTPFLPAAETTVIFVRHGNVHNPGNLIYGRLPRFRLSALGRKQLERTGQFLAALGVDVIYTSPLLRARQSAAILAGYLPNAPMRRNRWLVEVHTSWQGESNQVVQQTRGFSYYDPLKAEGDETILHVFTRMDRALRLVRRRHPGKTIVCVSHGDPIKILRLGHSGRPLTADVVRAPDPGQGSMVVFSFWHRDALPVITALDLSQIEREQRATPLKPPPRSGDGQESTPGA